MKEKTLEQKMEEILEKATKSMVATLHKEMKQYEERFHSRFMTIQDRLSSLEKEGMSFDRFDSIVQNISQLRYTVQQSRKAIEELLKFFNITKNLFKDEHNSIDEPKVSS